MEKVANELSTENENNTAGREGYKQTKLGWIPEDWDAVPFGSVVRKSQYGLSISSSEEGTIPMFKMNNFKDGKMRSVGVDRVVISQKEIEEYRLEKGDVLFNRTNSYELVGKTGIFDLDGTYVFASYLVRFRMNEDVANHEFVNFYLNSSSAQQRLKAIATLGVSQSNINPTNLRSWMYVPLPPLLEQQKIARILSAWDQAIEKTQQLIAAKEKRKKGLMQQLLTGKKRLPGFNEKWHSIEFRDIACRTHKKHNPKSERDVVPCIELEHIDQGKGSISGFVKSDKQSSIKNVFRKGQILFGKLRPYLRKYWLAEFNGVCSSEIWVLRGNGKGTDNLFLYYLIQQHKFMQIANATSGSKMPRADWDLISKYPFIVPKLPEQIVIARVLQGIDDEIKLLNRSLGFLRNQKKGLMQKLLTGQIRVQESKQDLKD